MKKTIVKINFTDELKELMETEILNTIERISMKRNKKLTDEDIQTLMGKIKDQFSCFVTQLSKTKTVWTFEYNFINIEINDSRTNLEEDGVYIFTKNIWSTVDKETKGITYTYDEFIKKQEDMLIKDATTAALFATESWIDNRL